MFFKKFKDINEISEDTVLTGSTHAHSPFDAVALDKNHVAIIYCYANSNTEYTSNVYGMVCTINGKTITKGTETLINNDFFSGTRISVAKLTESKIIIAHSGEYSGSGIASYVAQVTACTISGTTIKVTKTLVLNTGADSGFTMFAEAIDENRAIVCHNDGYMSGDKQYLMAHVCTFKDNDFTKGSQTSIDTSSTTSGVFINAIKIDEDKILILHNNNSSSSYLYGIVCTITGTTITKNTNTSLSSTKNTASIMSPVLIDNNKVVVFHSYNTDYLLYAMILTISGTTISKRYGY